MIEVLPDTKLTNYYKDNTTSFLSKIFLRVLKNQKTSNSVSPSEDSKDLIFKHPVLPSPSLLKAISLKNPTNLLRNVVSYFEKNSQKKKTSLLFLLIFWNSKAP